MVSQMNADLTADFRRYIAYLRESAPFICENLREINVNPKKSRNFEPNIWDIILFEI